MPPERHLTLLPPPEPEPELTWRDREWWDAGGVVAFLLLLVAPVSIQFTYGILSWLR